MIKLERGQLYLYSYGEYQYIIKVVELGILEPEIFPKISHTVEVLKNLSKGRTNDKYYPDRIIYINSLKGSYKPISKQAYELLYNNNKELK